MARRKHLGAEPLPLEDLRTRFSLLRRRVLESVDLNSPAGRRLQDRTTALGKHDFADDTERLAARCALYEQTLGTERTLNG